jgi:hypothetical protein
MPFRIAASMKRALKCSRRLRAAYRALLRLFSKTVSKVGLNVAANTDECWTRYGPGKASLLGTINGQGGQFEGWSSGAAFDHNAPGRGVFQLGEGEAERSTFSRSLPAWMRSRWGRCSRPKPRDHSRFCTVLPQERRPMRPRAGAERFRRGRQILAPLTQPFSSLVGVDTAIMVIPSKKHRRT